MTGNAALPPEPFTFSLASAPYVTNSKSGSLQVADSNSFKVSTTVAGALATIKPSRRQRLITCRTPQTADTHRRCVALVTSTNTAPGGCAD
jgi:hypothetical protein